VPDPVPTDRQYQALLQRMKDGVRRARIGAIEDANRQLVGMYIAIGAEILREQQERGWGAKVIDQLAADLKREFAEMTGLSRRNLHYMRKWPRWSPRPTLGSLTPKVCQLLH
jgi:DUF1016 N-terminal domain